MTHSRRGPRVQIATLLVVFLALATTPSRSVELEDVLARFDEVQDSIRTLTAEFTETTKSTLLKEPIVAKGKVFLTKPHSVRWEYSIPEEMQFVISEDRYTGYFPKRKQAEKRDIHRWREQLFRFLGLGQASAELAKFYNISVESQDGDMEGTYLLVLDPKKKRVRKRMDAVHFWIDDTSYLPVRVEYSSKSGNSRIIVFDRMDVNPDLAASLYNVDLPSDVEVKRGFSALSGFSASPAN